MTGEKVFVIPPPVCRDVLSEREERRQGQGCEGPGADHLMVPQLVRERAHSDQAGAISLVREREDSSDILVRQLREL